MARRILYVHGMDAIGGAERDLLLLLERLDRTRWSPTVACPPGGAFRSRLDALGIPIIPVTFAPWRKLASFIVRYVAVRELSAALGTLQPDLVHVNDIWWVPHTLRAVRRLTGRRIPIIAHVRQNIRRHKVEAYALDQADHVVAVSHRVQVALEKGGVRPRQLTLLHSGVDLPSDFQTSAKESVRATHGIPSNAFLIGTVANLLPIKGYESMIHALSYVRLEISTAHYLVVGAGAESYGRQLLKLCADIGVRDRVHFAGFQDPSWPYLAAMDVYVQPSHDEALGIAAVEAMAMGKPVVATCVGGLPEVVDEGKTGLLVPPGDVSALSKAIVSLFHDPAGREHMSACGRERARQYFNIEKTLAGMEQIYETVLAGGRHSG